MYRLALDFKQPELAQIALDAYIYALRPEFAHEEIFSHMLYHDSAAERLTQYACQKKKDINDAGGFRKSRELSS